MKDFIAISSNTIAVHNQSEFKPSTEIIISAVEPEYVITHNAEGKADIEKQPKIETFRFFATMEHLLILQDRINKEIETQNKITFKIQ